MEKLSQLPSVNNSIKQTTSNSHITFDPNFKTFRIYAGDSLYAFSISPELSLEHLYWGKRLPEGFDLRYLSQSSRMTVFNTAEMFRREEGVESAEMKVVIRAETLEEIQHTWKLYRSTRSLPGSPVEGFTAEDALTMKQKRIENAVWRKMAMRMGSSEANVPTDGACIGSSESAIYRSGSIFDDEITLNLPPVVSSENKTRVPNRSRSTSVENMFDNKNFASEQSANKSMENEGFASNEYDFEGMNTLEETGMETPPAAIISSDKGLMSTDFSSPIGKKFQSRARTPSSESDSFRNISLSPSRSASRRSADALTHSPGNAFCPANALASYEPEQTPGLSPFDRKSGIIGKGELCVEYSDVGTGDFRSPSFSLGSSGGYSISPLKYVSHKILKGKKSMPYPLPGIRSTAKNDSTTLVVTLADIYVGIEVDLIYVALHEFNAITRRAVFRRTPCVDSVPPQDPNSSAITIQRAHSLTIDFEASSAPFHLLQLSGNWARENQVYNNKICFLFLNLYLLAVSYS